MKKKYFTWLLIAAIVLAALWAFRPEGWLNPVPVDAALQEPDLYSDQAVWIQGTVSKRQRLGTIWRSFRLCADNGCDCITVKTHRSVLPKEGKKIRVHGKLQELGFNVLIFVESRENEGLKSWLNW